MGLHKILTQCTQTCPRWPSVGPTSPKPRFSHILSCMAPNPLKGKHSTYKSGTLRFPAPHNSLYGRLEMCTDV